MRALQPQLWRLLASVLLISVSCSQFPITLPVTEPEEEESIPVTDAPTPAAQLAEIKLPPTVVEFKPRAGQVSATEDTVISVLFDQPMDQASVEAALQVTPEVEGEFTWRNERELSFVPKVLAAAKEYQVSLGTGARSQQGLELTRVLAFSFSTSGPLEVTRVTPSAGAVDFRADTPLLIAFNQPVVALNCTGQVAGKTPDCPALPLSGKPRISGQGFWVNTSLYRFEPRLGWDAGQQYALELARTFTSVAGASLTDPYRWSFTPAEPRILTTQPGNGDEDVLLTVGVRVDFNTPMDTEATGSAFSLTAQNGELVLGTLTWVDKGAALVFTPTERLALGTRYMVMVNENARALTGASLEVPLHWAFTTVSYPAIQSITPQDGSDDVKLYQAVQITFEGALDKDSVAEQLVITPALAAEERYLRWEGQVLYLSWDKEPRSTYCVEVPAGVSDIYGHQIQDSLRTCFTTGDLSPLFSPTTRLDAITLDADAAPEIYVLSRNASLVSLALRAITPSDFLNYETIEGPTLRRWDEHFRNAPNQVELSPVELTRNGAALPTGYYQLSWVLAEARGWRSALRLAVIDSHLTLKMSTDEALIWATDLASGQPITETEVRLLDEAGTLVAAGTTDADGLAKLRIGPLESLWDRYLAVMGEPGQPTFGVSVSHWDAGAAPWDFDIDSQYGHFVPYNIYLYSDRPIYRPGQTVRLRGILRAERDVRYSLPNLERTVELALRDTRWDTIYTTTATLSELGGFEADFELTSVAELGEYAVQARLEGVEHCWELPFTVAVYRKPEFEVAVSPEMDDLLQGETARVLVESNYYFGGAVGAAPLQWKVYAQPAHFAPGIEGWWRWGGGGWWQPEPEVIASGAATTDAQGRFLLELPAELAAWGDEKESAPGSQQWEFEVTVTDEAGFPVTGRGQLTVHATRFYLGLQPRQWVVTAGEQALVDVQALDWESVPVAEQEVEVKLAQRQWYQVPPAEPFAQSTWGYTDTVVSTLELVTDRQGRAEANVTPPNGGSYVILASATDADGRPVQAECRLWVSGPGGMAWKMAEGRVAPVADAESYRPGDTASILLPTPFEGPFQVLMTVERGSILETRRLVFDQANPTIELPIQSVYAPNIYVSFVVVKGKESLSAEGALVVGTPDVRLGLVELQVEPVAQTLAVELTANPAKANYQPGDEIELTVRTVDAEGRTVDSEVGIAVVDKAVLALKEPNALSIGERFYGQRPLGVRTGNSLLMLFNRLTADLEELAQTADRMAAELELGGRGGGGGGAPALAVVRHEFPDTALWETRLRTGLDGEATVSFELPDSLTTWQVDARAVTADTKVGDALEGLVISKPLLVRPVTPRFFVAGDQLAVAAVVHNNTAEQLQVAVRLDATGLAIEGDIEQLAIIPAGGRQRVSWPVSVPASGAKAALLTFSASADTYRDATRPTLGRPPDQALPIYRYETPDVMGASGVLDEAGSRLEAVAVPSQAGDDTELTVHLDASLAASMLNGLTYLENYPYGCTEQLVSRFLPNLLTYRALQELELVEPELAERLPGLVREGVGQLYARQNGDGGWGWWSTGQSTLQISAYATLGLLEAERAGFAVRDKELSLALFYLRQVLQEEVAKDLPQWTRAHTLAFYVISLAGRQWPENVANSLYAARDELGVTGRSQLALAFGVVDVADRRVTTLLDELRGDAEITATGAHWEDTDVVSWATDTRATAVALDALARLAPDDQLLSQVVRWLLTARRGDHWRTTQETAWSLMALTDYLVATGELQANYDWGVALNGVAINAGAVTPETIWASEDFSLGLTADPATGLVRERTNALEIARAAGSGNLYYTAHLTLYQPVEEVEAESRGITLQRAYCEPVEEPGAAPESCVPVASAAPGDLVEVRLTLILPYSRYHLILEDPYPAGMEPVDPTLLTEQQYLDGPDMQPEPLSRWGWWWNPFTHRELRDERAVFFAESLSSGTYQVRYLLRAALPGTYRVLPATASEMYFPEVWGRTAGDTFQVSE